MSKPNLETCGFVDESAYGRPAREDGQLGDKRASSLPFEDWSMCLSPTCPHPRASRPQLHRFGGEFFVFTGKEEGKGENTR